MLSCKIKVALCYIIIIFNNWQLYFFNFKTTQKALEDKILSKNGSSQSRVGFVQVTIDELGKSLSTNPHRTEKEVSQLFLGYFPAHLIGKMGQTQDISGLFFLMLRSLSTHGAMT